MREGAPVWDAAPMPPPKMPVPSLALRPLLASATGDGDRALLARVLCAVGLSGFEREAFARMGRDLDRWSALSQRQREWLEGVAGRLGVLAGDRPAIGLRPKAGAWEPRAKRPG